MEEEGMFDLVIRNGTLPGGRGRKDIAILKGKVARLAPAVREKGRKEIDAKGLLVTESFANTHLHLCKVFTLSMMNEEALKSYHGAGMGNAMNAIELAAKVKEKYAVKWILPNVRKALRQAISYGCTHIRAFADVDSKAKLIGVEALIAAREEFRGVVDVQVVAFPQDGVVREPGTEKLIRDAMKMGADVVGGIPWIELTDADAQTHVDKMVDIADRLGKDVSMLVDDAGDPTLRTTEMLAVALFKRGMIGKGLVHHARAMALYPQPYFRKLSALLKKAQMGVVSDPHTGPMHARVRELLDDGNLVSLGQDDISDAYYPYGRNNMLEVAFLGSHLLWMTTAADMEVLLRLVTTDAARCINVKGFGIAEGNVANLVVHGQPDVNEALRYHEKPLHVVSHGKLVDLARYTF